MTPIKEITTFNPNCSVFFIAKNPYFSFSSLHSKGIFFHRILFKILHFKYHFYSKHYISILTKASVLLP